MRTALLFASMLTGLAASAQADTLYIHKFAQHIGREVATHRDSAEYHLWSFDYQYVDRGSPVGLRAKLRTNSNLQPLVYQIRGGTSRFSQVNDSIGLLPEGVEVRTNGKQYSDHRGTRRYLLSGYAPATAQALLVRWWKRNGMPAAVPLAPAGTVRIRRDGSDTIGLHGSPTVFTRYVISGLIWGNELLWLDESDRLACLITNDAEGDKQEVLDKRYEALLPEFITRAATIGMRLFTASARPEAKANDVTAIAGGRLVDIQSGATINNSLIVVSGGIIRYAGAYDAARIPRNARRVDARGMTVLPGLWDMHAHFQQAEWGPAYLASGITSVRDCGNEFEYINAVKAAIDAGSGVGPSIYRAGIIDGKGPYALGVVQAATPAEAQAAVRRYHAAGYDEIKIYSSMTPAVVKAVTDEAHRLALPVTGHIPEGMTLRQALDSGFDMVNHIEYVWGDMKRTPQRTIDFSDSSNQALLRHLAAKGVVVDPTVVVYELGYRDLRRPVSELEPAFATLPVPLRAVFEGTGTADTGRVVRGAARVADFARLVKGLVDAGVPVVCGSDMGFPGYSVLRELELYVKGGLTPLQALQTATIVPARVLGVAQRNGSIDAGKYADLLLVRGNPLERISDIRKTAWVMRRGVLYQPDKTKQMAGFEVPLSDVTPPATSK